MIWMPLLRLFIASLFNAYRLKGDYAESVEEFARNQELIGESRNALLIVKVLPAAVGRDFFEQ